MVAYRNGIRPRYSHSDLVAIYRLSTCRPIDNRYAEPHFGANLVVDTAAVHCVPTPAFVRREHNFVYVPAALDIITDIMRRQGERPYVDISNVSLQ